MQNKARKDAVTSKLAWQGQVVAVQPRIRLLRSFDQRSHNYLGYVLRVEGLIAGEKRESWLGSARGRRASTVFVGGIWWVDSRSRCWMIVWKWLSFIRSAS